MVLLSAHASVEALEQAGLGKKRSRERYSILSRWERNHLLVMSSSFHLAAN